MLETDTQITSIYYFLWSKNGRTYFVIPTGQHIWQRWILGKKSIRLKPGQTYFNPLIAKLVGWFVAAPINFYYTHLKQL